MRLSTRAIILVAIPVAAEILSVATLYSLFEHVRVERAKAAHSAELVAKMNTLHMLATERNVALITQSVVGGDPVRKLPARLEDQSRRIVYEIDALVKGHEDEEGHWKVIKALAKEVDESLVLAGTLYKKDENVQAKLVMVKAENAFAQTFKHINQMCARQRESQKEMLSKEDRTFQTIETALLVSVLASIFLAFSLLVYFNRSTSDRLSKLIANAVAMGKGQEPQYQIDGADELAQLHKTYSEMYSDLTTIRERERDILEHAAEGIASISKAGAVQEYNQAFIAMFGLGDKEIDSLFLADMLDAQTLQQIEAGLEKAHKQGHNNFSVPAVRADGKPLVMQWSANWSENTERYNCVVLDITEKAELERLKSEFVAMVSHDLRSPLNAVQLAHEFLEAEDLSAEGAATLRESSESIGRLLALVNNLLDLDKIESAAFSLDAQVAPLLPVLEEAMKSSRLLAEQGGIKLVLQADPQLNARFDDERILQVLFNLLSNAFKFSERGTQVVLSARKVGNMAVIQVDDEGRGIPEEMLEAVFERFKQVDPAQDGKRRRGSGLGLAISKAIVESHGGKIKAERRRPKGTSMRFTLPLA